MKDSDQTEKSKGGRPTLYKEEYNERVFKYCLLGVTDEQLSDLLNISVRTLNVWKKEYPKFMQSIRKGKEDADAEIAQALYHRAKGYSHPEDKIFNGGWTEDGTPRDPLIVPTTKHYPPDTAAAFIWLKNRAGWRDKQEHEHTADGLSFNMNFGPKGDE